MTICRKRAAANCKMKKWKRLWKLGEIEQMNPGWQDLYLELS